MKKQELINIINNEYTLESIDIQSNTKVIEELKTEFEKIRKSYTITDVDIQHSNLASIINKRFGLNVKITIEDSPSIHTYILTLDKNNVIVNEWQRGLQNNLDSSILLGVNSAIKGVVNLETATVSGDFSKILIDIVIGKLYLVKHSNITIMELIALLLHEIGHIFVYLEILARTTKTNYIISEGTKRLLNSQNKEQRIKILTDIENAINSKIPDKDKLADEIKTEEVYTSIIILSDIKESKRQFNCDIYNNRMNEHLSDVFVSRFGMSRYLALALDKMYKVFNYRATWSEEFNRLINKANQLAYKNFGYALFLLMNSPSTYDIEHDEPKVRVLKIRQQIINNMKQPNLSNVTKVIYLEDYKIVDDIYNKLNDNKTNWDKWYNILFAKAKKEKSEVELNLQIEALYNNPLFKNATNLSMYKKPLAIIIKGNDKYINNPKIKSIADTFYNDIKLKLEAKGYEVKFDDGMPYTIPDETASVWIAHSRGIDRLQYGSKNITKISLLCQDQYETTDKSKMNMDELINFRDKIGLDPKHYLLSDSDVKNINNLPKYN